MPDGTKLKKAKLRGVASDGMILAEDELAHRHRARRDHGPRRRARRRARRWPRCCRSPPTSSSSRSRRTGRTASASTASRARSTRRPARRSAPPPWSEDPGTRGAVEGVEVEVEVPDLCPRFTARVFEDVTIGESPAWLKARLMAAGHAADLERRRHHELRDAPHRPAAARVRPRPRRRAEARRARRARGGDDRHARRPDRARCRPARSSSTTPTARRRWPASWAARARRSPTTRRACCSRSRAWHAPTIQRTSTRLALRSRGERPLREGPVDRADDRGPGRRDAADDRAVRRPRRRRHDRRRARPARTRRRATLVAAARARRALLGKPIAARAAGRDPRDARLRRRPTPTTRRSLVDVPHFRRRDVTREADLVEEVARIDGLDNLPATLPSRRGAVRAPDAASSAAAAAPRTCSSAAACTRSSAGRSPSPTVADRLRLAADDPRRRFVAVANPMSEDQSHLRTTLLGSLLDAARHNLARGVGDLALFESGAIYLDASPPTTRRDHARRRSDRDAARARPGLPLERHALGALLAGRSAPASWRGGAGAGLGLLRRQGPASARCSTRCASRGTSARGRAAPVPAPRPLGARVRRRDRARLARRGAPARRARVGRRGRRSPRSSSTSSSAIEPGARRRRTSAT